MIHIKPFDYIFYRIATSKFYQKLDSKTPYIWAFGALSFCQLCNVLTIIDNLPNYSRKKYSINSKFEYENRYSFRCF